MPGRETAFIPEEAIIEKPAPEKRENPEKRKKEEPEPKEKFFVSQLLKSEIENWLKDLSSEISEEKGVAGPMTQFTDKFRDLYLSLRSKLFMAKGQIEGFFSSNPLATIEEFDKELRPELADFLPEGFYEKIRLKAEEYIRQITAAREAVKNYNDKEIFHSLAGKKPKSDFHIERFNNALIIITTGSEDYGAIHGAEDSSKSEYSGGFAGFCSIKLSGKGKPEINEIIPMAAIKLSKEAFDEFNDFAGDFWLEDLRREWDESGRDRWLASSGLDEDDIEDDEEIAAYEEFVDSSEEKYGGAIGYLMSNTEQLYSSGLNELKYYTKIIFHELSHIEDVKKIEVSKEGGAKLKDRADVVKHVNDLYQYYLDRMAGEILAYATGTENYLRVEEEEEFAADDHEDADVDDKTLLDILYNYPKDERKTVLSEIKKEVGPKNFKDWGVQGVWDGIEEKFLTAMKSYKKIADFIVDNRYNEITIEFFRLEPGATWPRLYRWLKKDPGILGDSLDSLYSEK